MGWGLVLSLAGGTGRKCAGCKLAGIDVLMLS